MEFGITAKSLMLGQFTSPIQTHLGNNNHCIVSLWTGAELSDAQLAAMYEAHRSGTVVNSRWPFNATTGMPSYGKTELARMVFQNFDDRYLGDNPLQRILAFSKRSDVFRATQAGTIGCFTLCFSNSDYTNSTAAAAQTNFILHGTCGLADSGSDLELSQLDIVVGQQIKMPDMTINFVI